MKRPTGRPPLSPIEYIEQERGHTSPCWIWQRSTRNGYGCLRIDGVTHYAHRVYYERHVIPRGLDLDHLCRHRACVNPAHLEPVTRAVNLQRGRRAKLKPEQVREIRNRLGQGARQTHLGSEYGVSACTISSIALGHTWKDI